MTAKRSCDKEDEMSWRPQFKVHGEWGGNAQRFATKEEAEASAKARYSVWTMPSDWRAIESDDPVNYAWQDGRDVMVNRELKEDAA
jgi:hypothetical protein